MKINTRLTYSFIELKVDEIETTIFKEDTQLIQDTIDNLLSVANEIARLNNKELSDYLTTK